MKISVLGIAAILGTVLLTGCGGGGGDITVGATVSATPTPIFDIFAYVNGSQIRGFDAEPGDVQTINLSVGQSFELTSNSSVTWATFVNGVQVPSANNTVVVGDVTITETSTTNLEFAGFADSSTVLPAPVQITLIATSLIDGSQTAQINFVITN